MREGQLSRLAQQPSLFAIDKQLAKAAWLKAVPDLELCLCAGCRLNDLAALQVWIAPCQLTTAAAWLQVRIDWQAAHCRNRQSAAAAFCMLAVSVEVVQALQATARWEAAGALPV